MLDYDINNNNNNKKKNILNYALDNQLAIKLKNNWNINLY